MKKLICVLALLATLTACGKDEVKPSLQTYDNNLPTREKQVLADAEVITLRKMNPDALWSSNRTGLQAYKTVSITTLKGEQAHKASAELLASIEKADPQPTNCVFVPDYALSVKSGGRNYDYLISYECKSTTVYAGGEDVAWLNIEGTPDMLASLVKPDVKPSKKTRHKKK